MVFILRVWASGERLNVWIGTYVKLSLIDHLVTKCFAILGTAYQPRLVSELYSLTHFLTTKVVFCDKRHWPLRIHGFLNCWKWCTSGSTSVTAWGWRSCLSYAQHERTELKGKMYVGGLQCWTSRERVEKYVFRLRLSEESFRMEIYSRVNKFKR